MNIHVRQATATNLDAILVLNREVQALHASLAPEHFSSEVDEGEAKAFFAGRLEKANHEIWLAESLGRPGGYVWFKKQEKAGTPFSPIRRRIYVHHIVVAADCRRNGVASSLLQCAEAAAHGAGMQRVVLDRWAANFGALAFFNSEGFASLSMTLRRISATMASVGPGRQPDANRRNAYAKMDGWLHVGRSPVRYGCPVPPDGGDLPVAAPARH